MRASTAKLAQQQRVTIRLMRPEPTRIAVVADSHSVPHPKTLQHLRALDPEAILHAGDIGDLSVLDALREVAPVFAVRGNIDERVADLPDTLIIDLADTGGGITRMLLTHIAVAGPRLRSEVAAAAKKENARLVICGHSHVPFIGQDKGIAMFNPGSIGPRRFALPIVFGTIELSNHQLSLHHYECESGREWAPQ